MKQQETLAQKKSQLAKLMATENITVRHRKVQTAYFDLQKRVLHCPIWKDMNSNIYDLLMGHEISHALNTPLEGWHDTIVNDKETKTRPNIKKFLNVVEDVRIEKLIKRKYPGLRRPFADAYKAFHERDMFKTAKYKDDYSKLGLIDRINLFMKVGAHLNITFDKEEQVFVDRAEELETFEETIQLARDIYDYQKFKEPEKEKQKQNKEKAKKEKKPPPKKDEEEEESDCDTGEGGESGGDDEECESGSSKPDPNEEPDESGSDDSDEGDDSDTQPAKGEPDDADDESNGGDTDEDSPTGDSDGSSGDSPGDPDKGDSKEPTADTQDDGQHPEDDKPDESSCNQGAGSNTETPPEEPTSETDDAYREQERELVNMNGDGLLYIDMPKANLEKIIIPHKMIVAKYEMGIKAQLLDTVSFGSGKEAKVTNYDVMAAGLNSAFHSRNKGFVNMLVKEFEMRKNAHQYSRQLTSKTGELDDRKISQYRLTNDIFRKITTVDKGKSHGMIMFLDFSGSMSNIIREILEQVLVLCTFCKRIGIPFDVYGFGDAHSYDWNEGGEKFTTVNDGFNFNDGYGSQDKFCLRHLISSNLGGNAYKRAFTMLNVVGQISNQDQRDVESDKCFPKLNWRGNINKCGFELGGTPFNQCLVASKYIIDKFKDQHHVDITNVIYLSDGDGYGAMNLGREYNATPYAERNKTRIGFRDYRTKLAVLTDNNTPVPYQTALTKLVGMVTDCRHIGYYFGTSDEIENRIMANAELKDDYVEHVRFLDKNGFVAVPNIGYDNYYYVNKDQTTYRGELKFAQGTTAQQMGKQFIDHQNKKMNNKLIIKEFATDVAEP